MQLEPIGAVVNDVHEAVDSGWNAVVSEVRLRSDMAAGLTGLAARGESPQQDGGGEGPGCVDCGPWA